MRHTLFLCLLALTLAQCKRHTPIAHVNQNPEKYQAVGSATIKGIVTSKIDILGMSTFTVQDESGDIRVFSNHSYQKGQKVVIKGHVENILNDGQRRSIHIFKEDADAQ